MLKKIFCFLILQQSRYLRHFSKFVDAVTILSSAKITPDDLKHSDRLLRQFVAEFEVIYSSKNMVFNIHLLLHVTECVTQNGPLFCYSNYNFEDNMGYLLSNIHGTTDAVQQVCSRYLMEQELNHNIKKSPIAREYNDEIQSRQRFKGSLKQDTSYAIKKNKNGTQLNETELVFIKNSMRMENDVNLAEFFAILVDGNEYYETISHKIARKKHTNDHFVCIPEKNIFGNIKSIFSFDANLYIFILNAYREIDNENVIESMIWLEEKEEVQYVIIKDSEIRSKYVFLELENKQACVKFPNRYKRN